MPTLPDQRNVIQQRILGKSPLSIYAFGQALERIAESDTLKGIVLVLPSFAMGLADLQTLRNHLVKFRQSGKRIIAYAQSYEMANYLIASAADTIWLQTGGVLMTTGLIRQQVFLKNALDTVGLEADVVAITPFKSAADQLSRTEPSPESAAQLNWLLDSEYDILTNLIAEGRGISAQEVRAMVDNAPYTDLQAQEKGFISGLTNEEGFSKLLDDAQVLTWEQAESQLPIKVHFDDEQIAILPLVGTIVNGPSANPPVDIPIPLVGGQRMGDLTVVQQVRDIMKNESIKAVVLYINSPGGSATASEAMVSALEELAKTRPIVVVMGDVAASGGYYIATCADWIVAQHGTITGSIGVVLAKLINNEMLKKLRFNPFLYLRGENANIFSGSEKFTDPQRDKMRDSIVRIYDVFVQRVADARKKKAEEVDAIGGGRVWTGQQALEHGLVDELGGLEQGIAKARQLAHLPSTTPVRIFRSQQKQPLAAQLAEKVDPAAAVRYWFTGVNALANGKALYLVDYEWR
jgi:protease-4